METESLGTGYYSLNTTSWLKFGWPRDKREKVCPEVAMCWRIMGRFQLGTLVFIYS
jgi:hypothetical protein